MTTRLILSQQQAISHRSSLCTHWWPAHGWLIPDPDDHPIILYYTTINLITTTYILFLQNKNAKHLIMKLKIYTLIGHCSWLSWLMKYKYLQISNVNTDSPHWAVPLCFNWVDLDESERLAKAKAKYHNSGHKTSSVIGNGKAAPLSLDCLIDSFCTSHIHAASHADASLLQHCCTTLKMTAMIIKYPHAHS